MSANKRKIVVQGTRAKFTFRLGQTDEDGITTPFDLTTLLNDTPKVCWKAGSTRVEKLLTDADVLIVGAATDGKIEAYLNINETLSMPKDTLGDIEIAIERATNDIVKFQIREAFYVSETVCKETP